jgi:tetratricopeptide (TPR) repeat protein
MIKVEPTTLQKIRAVYEDGKYLQAYRLAQQIGPLQQWSGPQARVLAGRLAYNLGSRKMGRVLHRVAMREHPQDFEVQYFYWLSVWPRRGPLATLDAIREIGDFDGAPGGLQADWFALRGDLYSLMRDFENADHWLNRALELEPDRAWLYVLQCENLKNQDRIDEAIAAAETALQIRPWYRPALQNLANRYVQANRDQEALELLEAGARRIESGDLRIQLAALYFELEQYEQAGAVYDSLDPYFPLIKYSKKREKWLASMRADVAYYRGEFASAAKLARQADEKLFKEFAERLEDPLIQQKRVRLPVKFVRQNHVTCAPATLTSITQYWELPAEHLDVVEKICYDGTPAHSERRWAEENGFVAREFKVTWDSAVALLDRGIPFTLTTVDPGSAHLQGVFGYDVHRKSFFIRDPGERHYAESFADKMLKHYAASGPRGMAMVPCDQAALLDGIELPEAELYDHYYQVELKLEAHDRDGAVNALLAMEQLAPDHRLTHRAEGNVARYDSDLNGQLESWEALLKKYPKDVNYQLGTLYCLSELGRRDDRIAMLEAINQQEDCDPIFWTRLANELAQDARQSQRVKSLLRKTIKYRPHDAAALTGLASMAMEERDDPRAAQLYRLAACLDEKNEARAKSYFYACRAIDELPAAIRFLQDRVDRFGNLSSYPARTLCWAFDNMEKTTEALEVIQQAYAQHKDDGEFLLYAADFLGRYGKFEKTDQLLQRAKGRCHPMTWRRGAALIATYRGQTETALEHWMAVATQDPLDHSAQGFVTELLADLKGPEAAIDHLRNCLDRFPNSYALRLSLIEWLRNETDDVRKHELDEFLKYHDGDAWALRERAMVEVNRRNFDAARADANNAYDIEPTHPAAVYILGSIAQKQGDDRAAAKYYRQCLSESIDYDYGMVGLLSLCNSKSERVAALQFIYQQLVQQVSLGEGWLTFSRHAQSCLEPAELLSMLEKAVSQRPDLWHAWSALSRQLSDMQRHDEAIRVAIDASQRFPLLPRVWMDLAATYAACGKIEQEIEALKRAKEINPTWGSAARQLSEAYEKQGDLAAAREEIEQVIRVEPRDVRNHGYLASLMWDQGSRDEALQQIAKAVRMEPGYDWAWAALRNWCQELGQPDFDVTVAQELVQSRPNEARSWLVLARCYDQEDQVQQSTDALDKAIDLNPQCVEAYSMKAVNLCRMGDYPGARAAAAPAAFGDKLPIELQARGAWIDGDQGNFAAAVAKMEHVVEIDPDYYWAWNQLADWYDYLEQPNAYRGAAQQMIRIEPQNPVSWGYLADGELREGNRDQAKQFLQQAVQISPAYNYGSGKLVELLIEDEEFASALEVVDTISPHIPAEWVLSEKCRIAALRGSQQPAFQYLRQLCVTPADGVSAIDGAVEQIYHAGWADQVMPLLKQSLNDPDAQPGAAYAFVNLAATMEQWDEAYQQLTQLHDRPPLWQEGIAKYIYELATGGLHDRMEKVIRQHRAELRDNTHLWEEIGSAYCSANLDAHAIEWMSDWKQRQQSTSAGLLPLVASLWGLKRDHQASEVGRHVMEHKEADQATGLHLTQLSKYEMVYGDQERAANLIRDVDPMGLNAHYRFDWELIIAILLSLQESESYGQLVKRLQAIWNEVPKEMKVDAVKRTYGLFQYKAADLHNRGMKKWWFKRFLAS